MTPIPEALEVLRRWENAGFEIGIVTGRPPESYDASLELQAMVRANLVAERIAIETYRQMIALIGDKDPTTRRMLEEILSDEEEHADELKDWLGH